MGVFARLGMARSSYLGPTNQNMTKSHDDSGSPPPPSISNRGVGPWRTAWRGLVLLVRGHSLVAGMASEVRTEQKHQGPESCRSWTSRLANALDDGVGCTTVHSHGKQEIETLEGGESPLSSDPVWSVMTSVHTDWVIGCEPVA